MANLYPTLGTSSATPLRGALACIGTPLPDPHSDHVLAAPPAAAIRGFAAAADAAPPAVGMTVK